MANKYADWMTNTLGITEAPPPPEAGVMGYVSPTFKPKFKTAAEAAKAAGQTDFTPEPYKYVEPASTNKRIANYSTVPGGINAVKYGGMAPVAEAAKIVYNEASKAAKIVYNEASKTPEQRGREFQMAYNGTTPTAPVPVAKPVTTIPSAYMKNLIQEGAGTVGINKMIDTQADKTVAANNRPAIGSQVPPYMQKMNAPAPVAPVDPQQARIKAYQDFMAGSKQRGDEALARWNDPGQQARYGFKAYSSNPKAREEQAMARENRAAQNAQANVAGEREAGVERFKATEAARGAIGAKEAAAAGEAAGINLKGGWDVKAAEAKYSAMAPERRSKMLDEYSKALTNAEPGSQLHTLISQELSAMGANPATTNASTMTTAQKKDAIKKANPGKTDAELASLYQKHGVV